MFVLIALVWFYVLALILLAGAVVNELRFEATARPGRSRVAGRADRLKERLTQPNTGVDSDPESSLGDEDPCCHDIGGGRRSRLAPARARRPRGGR